MSEKSYLNSLRNKHDYIVLELRGLGFECEDRHGYNLPELSLIEDEANSLCSSHKIEDTAALYQLIGKLDLLQDLITELEKNYEQIEQIMKFSNQNPNVQEALVFNKKLSDSEIQEIILKFGKCRKCKENLAWL